MKWSVMLPVSFALAGFPPCWALGSRVRAWLVCCHCSFRPSWWFSSPALVVVWCVPLFPGFCFVCFVVVRTGPLLQCIPAVCCSLVMGFDAPSVPCLVSGGMGCVVSPVPSLYRHVHWSVWVFRLVCHYARVGRRCCNRSIHFVRYVHESASAGRQAGWGLRSCLSGWPVATAGSYSREQVKPVRTPVAILGSLGVCIYVPASRHWLISYSPIPLT